MGDNVYLHESVKDLMYLLYQLRVVGVKRHKIPQMVLGMPWNVNTIQPDWIPMPVGASIYAEFLEIIPLQRRDR